MKKHVCVQSELTPKKEWASPQTEENRHRGHYRSYRWSAGGDGLGTS